MTSNKPTDIFEKEFFESVGTALSSGEPLRFWSLLHPWFQLQYQFQQGKISIEQIYILFLTRMNEMGIDFKEWSFYVYYFTEGLKKDGVKKIELENGLIAAIT
tara:strand:+ start:307 stop:615 length:309 start_codon:yes stop_codon:yes gene_type:complete